MSAAFALLLSLAAGGGLATGAGRAPSGGSPRVAVGRADASADPHAARTADARWLAASLHCGLFRLDARGRSVPDLARDAGRVEGHRLLVEIADGAVFHSGRTIAASDVVKSLERLARLDDTAGAGPEAAVLRPEALGPTSLAIGYPKGVSVQAVRRLLGRPEAAVLEGGAPGPGRGCGAFRVRATSDRTLVLEAHDGHPRGRPAADGVVFVPFGAARDQATAFAFGEVDVSPRSRSRGRAGVSLGEPAEETLFAVPHPRWRGEAGEALRRAVLALAAQARLGRHVDAVSETAVAFAPGLSASTPPAPRPLPRLASLVVAFPDGDEELGEVARALRDALGPLSAAPARAVPVTIRSPGSGLAGTVREADPPWDLLVSTHAWASTADGDRALELAIAFGLEPPRAAAALAGTTGDFAKEVSRRALVLPLLHLRRPVVHGPDWDVGALEGGTPDLAETWRAR